MAEAALNLLLRDIRRHRAGEPVETLDRVFAHKLIKRRSTAPPAATRK
jgi:hypothetical protein